MTPPADASNPQQTWSSYEVGGVRVDVLTMDQAVDEVLKPTGPRAVHLCNAYTISLASGDRAFTECLNRGDLNLPDGMPLVWIAKWLGLRHVTERVYGPGLMAACLDRGRDVGAKHFLYGSTPEVLAKLQAAIERRWPGTEVVGVESPPFRRLDDAEVAAAVSRFVAAGADVVWVGLGTPKQDWEVDRLKSLGGPVYVAVGAAFDFLAGTKKLAPEWMQRAGLEWLHRLACEPRRLWRRYLVGNTKFIVALSRCWPKLALSQPSPDREYRS